MKEMVIFTTALCLSTMTQMMAQNIIGKVMNTKGEPLAFANVVFLKSATIIQYTIKGRFMNR